jgi:MFS family permease
MGLVMCSTGTVVSSLKYQLNWGEDPAKIDWYTTVLSSSNIVGIALGSIFGGDFIKYGRRISIIAFNLMGLIGSAFSFMHSFYFLCFGRILFGFSAGVIMCATPKMLDETIPAHLIEKGFGTSTNIIINLMVFLMLLMGMGIPESPAELMDSKYWMIIYGIQCPF